MAPVALHWADVDRHVLTSHLSQAVVLVPVGATEQHGPHLPTGTDALIAGAVCDAAVQQAARRSDRTMVITPTVPFGASDHHLPFGGTLSLSPETLLAVVLDIARCVSAQGGRRLVLINGHGGNVGVCHAAAAAASTRYGLAVAHLDYWRLAQPEQNTPVPGHAGEFETSMVLALRPGLVGERAARPGPPAVATVPGIDIHSAETWRSIDGYTDRPELADAESGKRRFEHLVEQLADRLVDLVTTL
jgi:creatinine amidohydrolase